MNNNGCLSCGLRLAFVVFVIIAVLSSCTTHKKIEYRDRDVNHYITQYVHDTLRLETKDSTYHFVKVLNDTVFDTKYVERTKWRDKVVEKHDTCYRDSVVTQYKETIKEVTKVPKIYSWSLIFSVLVLIYGLIKLTKWFKIL